jgi:multiple sugar transport system permease protein
LTNEAFIESLQRVLLFGVVQVPLMITLATTLALLLESGAARGARFFRAAYFLPYGVPGVIARWPATSSCRWSGRLWC